MDFYYYNPQNSIHFLVLDVEKTMEEAIISKRVSRDQLIWVKQAPEADADSSEESKEVKDYDKTQLHTLCGKLKEIMEPTYYIAIDNDKIQESLDRFSDILQQITRKIIGNCEKYDRMRYEIAGKGKFYLKDAAQ